MKATLVVVAAIVAIVALLYVATVPSAAPPEITDAEIAQREAAVREGCSPRYRVQGDPRFERSFGLTRKRPPRLMK